MLLIGIFADFLAPYGMNDLNLPDRLTPPSDRARWRG
jgi:ABC-type antimicrobial peptide transport system permease subunit